MKSAYILTLVAIASLVVASVASKGGERGLERAHASAPSTALSPYFSWPGMGCPADPLPDSAYNEVTSWTGIQWWTVTFTDNENTVGGMINFVRTPASTAILQVYLTHGTDFVGHPGSPTAFHDSSSDDSARFCIGSGDDTGCFSSQNGIVTANGKGSVDGKSFAYDLRLTRQDNVTWCLLNEHYITSLQPVSWLHYAPRAHVTGTVTVNGVAKSVNGVGQQDHVHGGFIPGVTLFKHWVDAHFFSRTLNLYWGSMYGEDFTFALAEADALGGRVLFTGDQVTHSRTYTSDEQPKSYSVTCNDGKGHTLRVTYTPLLTHSYSSAPSPVEDIVRLTGTACTGSTCVEVSARGWAQVMGGHDPSS